MLSFSVAAAVALEFQLTLTLRKTAALDADAERAFRKKLATPR